MSKEEKEFTEGELQYLEQLRTLYKMANPNLLLGFNGTYIQIGLAIIYMVKLENKIKHGIDEELFVRLLCKEYLNMSKLISKAINQDLLEVIDPREEKAPYPKNVIKNHLKKLNNNHVNKWLKPFLSKSNNYLGVLGSLVSYNNLFNSLINIGLDKYDPRVVSILTLQKCANDLKKLEESFFKTTDIIYCYEPKKETIQLSLPEKRQIVLKQYFKGNNLSIPVLIDDNNKIVKSMNDLWRELSKIEPDLFIFNASKSSKKAFFYCTGENKKLNKICAFSKNIYSTIIAEKDKIKG